MQNEGNKDDTRCYHPRIKTNQIGCYRLRKVVAESSELFYFLQQNPYMLRVLPAHSRLALQQVTNTSVWLVSR